MTAGRAPIHLPFQLQALNRLDGLSRALKLGEISEDSEVYLQRAQRRTGLGDYGSFDIATPLAHLLHTLVHEADLSVFGRIACQKMIMRNLVNNLLIEEEYRQHPDIDAVDVEAPIIIICTPRTGSTLLHNLMHQHVLARCPRMWELHRPSPAPRPETATRDQRIRASEWEFGLYYRLIPEMKAIHYFAPEAIEECTHLFAQSFSCRLSFSTLANRNRYTDWLWQQDMAAMYRLYKRHLKVLKYHYPDKRLILKSPGHILQLESLIEVFPNARLVHLHRDPATAAGSFCSLTEAVQISLRKQVDTKAIGQMWQDFWTPALLDSIDWRRKAGRDILDVDFKTLLKSPVESIEAIFEFAAWPADDGLEAKLEQYLSDHPKDEYGIHEYSLERYGLARESLHREYARYIETFQVSLESD